MDPEGWTSVLEEQLAVLRQRPEVVGDDRLEFVDDHAERRLGWDDLGRERRSLGLDRAGLMSLVLGMLQLGLAINFAVRRTDRSARSLFFGSITYLPLLWLLMVIGKRN